MKIRAETTSFSSITPQKLFEKQGCGHGINYPDPSLKKMQDTDPKMFFVCSKYYLVL